MTWLYRLTRILGSLLIVVGVCLAVFVKFAMADASKIYPIIGLWATSVAVLIFLVYLFSGLFLFLIVELLKMIEENVEK